MFTEEEKKWLLLLLSELQFKTTALKQHLLCDSVIKKLTVPKVKENKDGTH